MLSITKTSVRVLLVVFFTVLTIGSFGCTRSAKHVQRAAVQGTVKLAGKPLTRAKIVFKSMANDEIQASAVIENGSYQFSADSGPAVGTNRVEIYTEEIDFEEFQTKLDEQSNRSLPTEVVEIPAKYGRKSKLTVEVAAERPNQHDFDLE